MRKYTYIDTRTGERVYSDLPLRKTYFTKVTEIRGGPPGHMEKSSGLKKFNRADVSPKIIKK